MSTTTTSSFFLSHFFFIWKKKKRRGEANEGRAPSLSPSLPLCLVFSFSFDPGINLRRETHGAKRIGTIREGKRDRERRDRREKSIRLSTIGVEALEKLLFCSSSSSSATPCPLHRRRRSRTSSGRTRSTSCELLLFFFRVGFVVSKK